ncbi:MAG: 2'-5' RNA ligase family protein [Agriterribacter sp.]
MNTATVNQSLSPDLFEYLLVVSPAKEVYEKVMEEKQSFYKNYNQPIAIKTQPHITVSNFVATAGLENILLRWMQRATAEQECFVTQLNNYSGFPGNAVFIRVQNHDPFRELIGRLKPISTHLKNFGCPPFRFSTTPHMSIARSLSKDIYEKAMNEYARKDFTASFNVSKLTLLRKQYGNNYEKYQEVAILNLKPDYSRH